MSAALWSPAGGAFAFAKGRVGLYALLRAAGIGPGDEILIPGFTCVVVPAAIQYTGATPVYCDIDPQTLNADAQAMQAALGARTRAILLQHNFGSPTAPRALIAACRARGILVFEDAAHALGAGHGTRSVGELGDGAFASLQWNKPVSCGLGGLVRSDVAPIAAGLAELHGEFAEPSLRRQYAQRALLRVHRHLLHPSLYWGAQRLYRGLSERGLLRGSSDPLELSQPNMPADYCQTLGRTRLGDLDAALARLQATNDHRRDLAARIHHWLDERELWRPRSEAEARPIHLYVPLRVRERDRLLRAAQREGIEFGDWFNAPLHPRGCAADRFGYRDGSCPQAEAAAGELLNLPTHPRIDERALTRTLAFLDRHRALIRTRAEQAARSAQEPAARPVPAAPLHSA